MWRHREKEHKDKLGDSLPKVLETCVGIKESGEKGSWLRLDDLGTMRPPKLQQIAPPNFRVEGLFASKSGVFDRFPVPLITVFEKVPSNSGLMFWDESVRFLQRIKDVTSSAQYFLRRVAKRKHTGDIPIVGFQVLSCRRSETLYARTAARFLYYVMHSTHAQPPPDPSTVILGQSLCTWPEFVLKLILSAIREEESQSGWLAERYLHHMYLLSPYGAVSRDPDFLKHEAVRLLYLFRGSFILDHNVKGSTMANANLDGQKCLTEQACCAFESIQGFKRIAHLCVKQVPEDRVVWQDNGELAVRTDHGYIDVPKSAISAFYQSLIEEAGSIFKQMEIDPGVGCKYDMLHFLV